MNDYNQLDGLARYEALDTMAREIYGPLWKGKFAADYDLTGQTITSWKHKGAPVWACKAAHMGLTLEKLRAAQLALNVALS